MINMVTIEMLVEDAQELYTYLEKQESKIYWVLENRDPDNKKQLTSQAKFLNKIASCFKKALNDRAKANVIKLRAKK